VSGHLGTNASLIRTAADLYIGNDTLVLDMTYGKGAFWKETDLSRFHFYGIDLNRATHQRIPCPDCVNFRLNIEWGDYRVRQTFSLSSFNTVVFDPPYASGGRDAARGLDYGQSTVVANTPSGHSNVRHLLDMYEEGMSNAYDWLRRGGYLWVKGQNFIESGRYQYMQAEIDRMACKLGLRIEDVFTLVQTRTPQMRHKTQRHSRNNTSFLAIYRDKR
jgi:hypothetical protein